MTNLKACRVCKSKNVSLEFCLNNIPFNIWPSRAYHKFENAYVYSCAACGHIQLQDMSIEEIDELYSGEPFNCENSQENISRIKEIENFFGKGFFKSKRTLDIGGGRNSMASQIYGHTTVIDFDVNDNVKNTVDQYIENDFTKHDFANSKFDVIALIHTMEHINEPANAVRKMKSLLNDDGLVIIEVPDINALHKTKPHYCVFHQHVNLFYQETLDYLMATHGFKLVKNDKKNDVTLSCYKKGAIEPLIAGNPRKILLNLQNNLNKLKNRFIDAYKGGDLYIYGAGGSSSLFVAQIPELHDNIKGCFDREPRKCDKTLPGIPYPIKPAEEISQLVNETILFQNSQIQSSLAPKLNHNVRSICLDQLISLED